MAFYKVGNAYYSDELYHFRTPGSKNGVRKYQYEDGSLTPLGKIHYGVGQTGSAVSPYQARTNQNTSKPTSFQSGVLLKNLRNDARLPQAKNQSWLEKSANDARNWATGAVNNGTKWVDKAASDVGRAAKNAGNWVGERARDVGNAVNKAFDAESAKKNLASAKGKLESTRNEIHPDWYNNADEKRISSVDYNRRLAAARKEADKAQAEYDSNLGVKAENVKNWTNKAASDAKNWTENAFNDAKNWTNKAADDTKAWVSKAASDTVGAVKKAGDWVGDRASDVGKAVSGAAKDVAKWGGTAVENGRNFISGLFGKKKK